MSNSQDRGNHSSGYSRYNPSATSRPTFYMTDILLRAIEAQAECDHASRSSFVTGLLNFLLLSPAGQRLKQNAWANNRSLVQELEQSLSLFHEQLPLEEIGELADATHRSLPQMLTYLIMLGLQAEKKVENTRVLTNSRGSKKVVGLS